MAIIKIICILALLNNNIINVKYSYSPKTNVISSSGVGIKPFVVGDSYFMESKKCSRCKEIKEFSFFNKNKSENDGRDYYCKICSKAKAANYAKNNNEKIRLLQNIHYKKNKEKISNQRKELRLLNLEKHRLREKKYRQNNPQLINAQKKRHYTKHKKKIIKRGVAYKSKRIKIDAFFQLKQNLRSRITVALSRKKIQKNGSAIKLLGAPIEIVKLHLEKQFKKGMSWENYGFRGWHADHITPLASAKTEEDLIKLCHYTNLQPLWALENLKKSSKILPVQINPINETLNH